MTTPTRPPKYETVAARLRDRVTTMTPHEALPSERELMVEFDVSRGTVRQAIRRLIAAGLVYNVQGSGTYVADPDIVSKTPRLTSFTEDMRERGLEPASRVLDCSSTPGPAHVCRRLGLPDATSLIRVRRRRLADARPMALETIFLPETVIPFEQLDPQGSIYAQLAAAGHAVDQATQAIAAVNLDAADAYLLDQAVGAAALRVTRVGFTTRAAALEWAETIYRGDRYDFDMVVRRESE